MLASTVKPLAILKHSLSVLCLIKQELSNYFKRSAQICTEFEHLDNKIDSLQHVGDAGVTLCLP